MSDIYVSAKTTMDIGDKDNTHISTSKHMNGYIEDYIENLSTNEVLDFVIDSEQAKADTSFVPVPLWNYKIADLGNITGYLSNSFDKFFENIWELNSFSLLDVIEFIRSFEDNFFIKIGAILGDKYFEFHFTNLTLKEKIIKEVRVPGEAGIILASDYKGISLLPHETLTLKGKADYKKGAENVRDFLVIELESGEKLKFDFIIIRLKDNVFFIPPDAGENYSEEWTLDAITFESLNGILSVQQKSVKPKITNGKNSFTLVGKELYTRMHSIVVYGRESKAYQPLWFWMFPLDSGSGEILMVPLPSDNAYKVFKYFKRIMFFYNEKEFIVGQILKVTKKTIFLNVPVIIDDNKGTKIWVVPLVPIYIGNSVSINDHLDSSRYEVNFMQGVDVDNNLGL